MTRPELRPYQVQAIESMRAEFRRGKRAVLLVSPTGSGKTVLIAEISRLHLEKGGRVLVVCHRAELITQTVAKLGAASVERIGVIAAGRDVDSEAPCLVASVQTLRSRLGSLPPGVTLLILDEAHHFPAGEWSRIPGAYPEAKCVGLTATPERADGTPLGDIFDALVVVCQTRDLQAIGHLVPCDVVSPEKACAVARESAVEAWLTHAGARPGIAFAKSVEEAKSLAVTLSERGLPSLAVWGAMTKADREAAIAGFASGRVQVLTSMAVLTEGFDSPRAEVCMLARTVGHTGLYLQIVGRVLRPCEGKTSALLIDLKGASQKHGYPEDLRTFSLSGKAISGRPAPTKTCQVCGGQTPIACRECPHCGSEFPPSDGRYSAEDMQHAALVRMTQPQRERVAWDYWLAQARGRGYKPGWAVHQWKARFGRFPAQFWRQAKSSASVDG